MVANMPTSMPGVESSRMRFQWVAVGFALALAGCGEDSPTCTSGSVTDTVISLARKKFMQEGQRTLDPNVQQLAEGSYSVEAIRTQATTDSKVSCSAELHTSMKGNELRPIEELRKSGINTDPVFPITYEAQRTDNGRTTYVTLHELE